MALTGSLLGIQARKFQQSYHWMAMGGSKTFKTYQLQPQPTGRNDLSTIGCGLKLLLSDKKYLYQTEVIFIYKITFVSDIVQWCL